MGYLIKKDLYKYNRKYKLMEDNLVMLNLAFICKIKSILNKCKFVSERKKEYLKQVLCLDLMIMRINNLVRKLNN